MDEIKHRYVPTICENCVVRVSSFPDPDDYRRSYVDIQIISAHRGIDHRRLRERVRNSWDALRGRYDWSGFALDTHQEAAGFLESLQQAVEETWPTDHR